jgi:hypothetical protein
MRIRAHLTYANVMATVAVFGVMAGGGAYAASKIDTPDIANKAVTAKKLDSGAVRTSKLRPGAVTGDKLADGAVGTRNLSPSATLAVAGVIVYNGEVRGSFNRLSDNQPTLDQGQPGVYNLFIPGVADSGVSDNELLSSGTLTGTNVAPPGEISTLWTRIDTGQVHPVVYTFDSAGNPVDRDFTFLVYRADHEVR